MKQLVPLGHELKMKTLNYELIYTVSIRKVFDFRTFLFFQKAQQLQYLMQIQIDL